MAVPSPVGVVKIVFSISTSMLNTLTLNFFFSFRSDAQAAGKMSFNREFFDERWSRHRTVTCLDWSTQVLVTDAVVLTF